MNRCYSVLLLALLFLSSADAQRRVTLQHYQSDANYFTLNAPANSLFFSRFETTAPCKVMKVTIGVVTTQTAGDSLEFLALANDGGSPLPYRLRLLAAPAKLWIPENVNGLIDINFNPPLVLDKPTSFFLGVRRAWANATLKMDAVTQTPTCGSAEGDTMTTSAFAIYDAANRRWSFGSKFASGDFCNNWYISADIEYFNESPSTYFVDATALAQLDAPNNGRRMAWGDIDGDKLQDLLMGDKLYRNKGDGTFQDVSTAAGFIKGGKVNAFVDFDNDGDLDIICQPENLVYLNTNGLFALKANNGLLTSINTTAIAVTDYDGDKFPDCFVTNGEYMHVKNPTNPNDSALVEGIGYQAHLYRGKGDGTFEEKLSGTTLNGYSRGTKIGLNPYTNKYEFDGYRDTEGAQFCDFDNDGDPDLFVATGRGQENYLFVNQGTQRFINQAQQKSVHGNQKPLSSFYGEASGCEFADYDNDGDFDLLVGNAAYAPFYNLFDKTALYANNGALNSYNFTDLQPAANIEYNEWHGDVAWGDYNNDGLLDFYVTSTHGCHESALFQQNPDRTFSDVTYVSGTSTKGAQSATWVDYDNDGDLDLAVTTNNGFMLFRNDVNNNKNWYKVTLKSITANDFAIGARVTCVANGIRYTREVSAGKGRGSQNPYTLHFGLDISSRIDTLIIKWPKGNVDTYLAMAAKKDTILVEKTATPKPAISLSTTILNFGNVGVGKFQELGINVRNSGAANLVLSEQTLLNNAANQFSMVQAAVSPIAPNSLSEIKVRFAPTSTGLKTAQLRIGSNDPQYPTVTVDLNGTAIVSVKQLPGIAASTALYQNYPNPFAASTEMRYDVNERAHVMLTLYDALGRAVRTVVDQHHEAGSYATSFTLPSDTPTGMYTAVMSVRTADGTTKTFTRALSYSK